MLLIEDPRYLEIKRLAAEYEATFGRGGFQYPTAPGGGEPMKFVFQDHVAVGMKAAMTYAQGLGAMAEQRKQALAEQAAADEANEQMKDIT